MSRTIRVNRSRNWREGVKLTKCPDGKQQWKCKCSYCYSLDKKKALEKLAWTSDISIPDTEESIDYWIRHGYDYWQDFAWIEYYDYTQHESFIG